MEGTVQKCGMIPVFADDSTILVANKDPEINKVILKKKLDEVTEFLNNNDLIINQDKTTVQNYMVHQKRAKIECNPTVLTVTTQNEVVNIDNQVHTRILGINLNQDLSWRSHFELGEKPLLPILRRRLGAITHLGNTIPRKGKLILINGLIISKIIYMIQIWGGTHNVHYQKIQRIMNKAARYIVSGGRRWSTQKLMLECNWLNAKELMQYHTLISLWKILYTRLPSQLVDLYEWTEDRKILVGNPRLQLTASFFKFRSAELWNYSVYTVETY